MRQVLFCYTFYLRLHFSVLSSRLRFLSGNGAQSGRYRATTNTYTQSYEFWPRPADWRSVRIKAPYEHEYNTCSHLFINNTITYGSTYTSESAATNLIDVVVSCTRDLEVKKNKLTNQIASISKKGLKILSKSAALHSCHLSHSLKAHPKGTKSHSSNHPSPAIRHTTHSMRLFTRSDHSRHQIWLNFLATHLNICTKNIEITFLTVRVTTLTRKKSLYAPVVNRKLSSNYWLKLKSSEGRLVQTHKRTLYNSLCEQPDEDWPSKPNVHEMPDRWTARWNRNECCDVCVSMKSEYIWRHWN